MITVRWGGDWTHCLWNSEIPNFFGRIWFCPST